MKNNERRALCGICPAGCWVIVSYDRKGRIGSVRPDETSSLGTICKLGEHSAEIVYSRDRLLHPMKRKGPKGTYDFERISWDEAYRIIATRLNDIKEQYGPEASAIYTGRGSFELAHCDVFQPEGVAISSASSVLFPFGSPNTLGVGALCYVSFAMIAPHITMGGMEHYMFSDIERAQTVIVWGANPATDCPPYDFDRVIDAHRRGARVIVIDPRRTLTAKQTDAEWIPIRPGTDGALALALCNVIIEEELYDEEFVTHWTIGFDEFSQYVQHFTPEVAANITGIPAETILFLAREIAQSDGVSPIMYSGLEYSNCGVQAIRATLVLWALAGQLDVPGGRCFTMKENHFPVNRRGLVANPDVRRALGRNRFPVYSTYRGESHAIALPDSVLHGDPYRIRSLIILGASIITSWPEPEIWRKTLQALDFLVSIDVQITADAAYADIVLPAATMYEIESYMTYGPVFRIRERVAEPQGEARNIFFIMAGLAKHLGYGHLYPQNEEELLEYVLEDSGFTPEEVREGGSVRVPTAMMQYKKWEKGLLRDDGMPGFDTPSGKFEIASSILQEHGYDPLPVYDEPRESPLSNRDLAKRFPLVFNSGARVKTDFRSQHHGIRGLLKERPEPSVTINTVDAARRGIENGDLVFVETARGKVQMRAHATDDIVQGSVDANMGGGGPVGPKAWQECNINDLTDLNNYDPISGFPVYKALLCEVSKASQSSDKVIVDSGELMRLNEGHREIAVRRIYLDHNATTPLDPEVQEIMLSSVERCYGNPSAIYREGKESHIAVESARRKVAQLINCTARRIVFCGGGSEANNLAIKGIVFQNMKDKNHLITTKIEHHSVLNTCRWLEKIGMRVTYLEVDETGMVHPEDLLKAIDGKTCLISVMMANNETGTMQPIAELARIAREREILFHVDGVQAVGKIPVDVEMLGIDLLTISGHKLYGPKGCGALYFRRGVSLEPLVNGGSQEGGLRAGTENVMSIIGFGKASELAMRRLPEMNGIVALRDRLEAGIVQLIPDAAMNGHRVERLPNTLNMTLPGMRGESIVLAMDQKGVSLSSGSACRSGSPEPSHALMAMGLSEERVHCSVRFSLGINNTEAEIDQTISALGEILRDISDTIRFVACR